MKKKEKASFARNHFISSWDHWQRTNSKCTDMSVHVHLLCTPDAGISMTLTPASEYQADSLQKPKQHVCLICPIRFASNWSHSEAALRLDQYQYTSGGNISPGVKSSTHTNLCSWEPIEKGFHPLSPTKREESRPHTQCDKWWCWGREGLSLLYEQLMININNNRFKNHETTWAANSRLSWTASAAYILQPRPVLDTCIVGPSVWKESVCSFALVVTQKRSRSTPASYSLAQTKTSI